MHWNQQNEGLQAIDARISWEIWPHLLGRLLQTSFCSIDYWLLQWMIGGFCLEQGLSAHLTQQDFTTFCNLGSCLLITQTDWQNHAGKFAKACSTLPTRFFPQIGWFDWEFCPSVWLVIKIATGIAIVNKSYFLDWQAFQGQIILLLVFLRSIKFQHLDVNTSGLEIKYPLTL